MACRSDPINAAWFRNVADSIPGLLDTSWDDLYRRQVISQLVSPLSVLPVVIEQKYYFAKYWFTSLFQMIIYIVLFFYDGSKSS